MGLLDNKPQPSPGLFDQLGEYLRRSGRNLGMGLDAAVSNATANNAAIRAGADATLLQMQGQELTPEQNEALHSSPAGGFGTDAGGGGGAFAAMFAGAKSKTANKALLRKAKSAVKGGADTETVRQDTGWAQGPDGEWKYEISDHNAEVQIDPKTGNPGLYHPDLKRAYPDILKGLQIKWFHGPQANKGRFDVDTGEMWLNANLPPDEWTSVALHEIQHPIQQREGFSGGANPTMPEIQHVAQTERNDLRTQHYRDVDAYHNAFRAWVRERTQENPERFGRMKQGDLQDMFERAPENADLVRRYENADKELGWMDTPSGARWFDHQAYERAMGEYEARETQVRQHMTPDQRRAEAPYRHDQAIPQHRLLDMRYLRDPNDPPPSLTGLLNQTLGPSPEAKGLAASLLGIGLFPKDAE